MVISLGIYPIFRQTHTRWWFSWMLMAWFFLVIGIRGTMPKWLWAREKYLVVHTERASLAGSSFAQNLISKYRGFWKIGGSQGPIGFSTRMVNKNGMFFWGIPMDWKPPFFSTVSNDPKMIHLSWLSWFTATKTALKVIMWIWLRPSRMNGLRSMAISGT